MRSTRAREVPLWHLICVFAVAVAFLAQGLGADRSSSWASSGEASTAVRLEQAHSPEMVLLPRTFQASKQSRIAADMLFPAPMSEGFEGAWPGPGWTLSDTSDLDGGEYLWGKRDCHPHSGDYAIWAVGGGAQGSSFSCSDSYPNNVETWAIYGPFSLSNASSASLIYHVYGRSEGYQGCPYDFLLVGSSIDGEEFLGERVCQDATEGNAGNGYHELTHDLSFRIGEPQVWIAFLFVSDDSETYSGFIVDDVTLSVAYESPPHVLYLPLAIK